MNTLKVGQIVRVNPHTQYSDLRGGAVHSEMREYQHKGYDQATITAIYEDGGVEVEIPGGFDIVPESSIGAIPPE